MCRREVNKFGKPIKEVDMMSKGCSFVKARRGSQNGVYFDSALSLSLLISHR